MSEPPSAKNSRRASLEIATHTTLPHAVRWIATGERFLSPEDSAAVRDDPDIEPEQFETARRELLLALRHGAVRARGSSQITPLDVMAEDGYGPLGGYSALGDPDWDELIPQHRETLANVLDPIPVALWNEYYVLWRIGELGYYDDHWEVRIRKITVPADQLLGTFQTGRLGMQQPSKTNRPAERQIHPKEVDSLLKLAIGIAVAQYGYDPRVARSRAVPDIVSDLDDLGIRMDPDTIRKHLRKAAELLPSEALPGDKTNSPKR